MKNAVYQTAFFLSYVVCINAQFCVYTKKAPGKSEALI